MTFRAIAMFGVELEGGWDRQPPAFGRDFHQDGSVSVRANTVGELASPPFRSLRQFREYIAANYPQHVGVSCGGHVHISFRDQHTAVSHLLDPEFSPALLAFLRRWGETNKIRSKEFYARIDGENSYCRPEYCGNTALGLDPLGRHVDRYCAVNYHSLRKHGTVEIRVLPMFRKASTYVRAVLAVLAFVDQWCAKKERLPQEKEPIETEFSVTFDPAAEVAAEQFTNAIPEDS